MPMSRSHSWQLLVVCVIACLARAGMLWRQGELLNVDVDAYLEIAQHVAAGDGFSRDQPLHATAYRPPLYPLLIAAVFKLGGSPFVLGLIHVVLGTLTTVLTFRVARLLNLGSASIIAAGLVAIDPLLLQYTILPMTETLCATLVVLWCWCVLEFPTTSNGTHPRRVCPPLLHGATFGLICLCRPGFLAVVVFVAVGELVRSLIKLRTGTHRDELLRALRSAVWSAVGLGMVLGPWMVRNAVLMGKTTPATTHGGYTLLLANNPVFYHEVVTQPWGTAWQGDSLNRWQQELEAALKDAGIPPADEVSRDRWMYRRAVSHIQTEPRLFGQACVWRALRFWDLAPWKKPGGYLKFLVWSTAIFYGLISCGILVGLYRLRPVEWIRWRLLLLLPLVLWMTHWVYWTDMRMRAPVVPIIALLAARALVKHHGQHP